MYDSLFNDIVFLSIALVSIPVVCFLLVYCGLPAEIFFPTSCCCCRRGRLEYEFVHSLWHVISGVGPIAYTVYFYKYHPGDVSLGAGYLDSHGMIPTVPAISLIVSAAINVAMNIAGVAPLN
jgi:hypothetical protein